MAIQLKVVPRSIPALIPLAQTKELNRGYSNCIGSAHKKLFGLTRRIFVLNYKWRFMPEYDDSLYFKLGIGLQHLKRIMHSFKTKRINITYPHCLRFLCPRM